MDLDEINLRTNEGTLSETPWEKDIRARWRATNDEDDKYLIQRQWYCSKQPGDKPYNDFLRAKWASLFNRHVPVLEIMAITQIDTDKQIAHLRELEDRLANLKLAQAAHKKKKTAREDAKQEEQNARLIQNFSNLSHQCANEGCCNIATIIDFENTTIECEICRQMDNSNYKPNRVHNGWFCTEECKKTGELSHQIKHHPCASKLACLQRENRLVFTKSTYEEARELISLCTWCLDNSEHFTYFCSKSCADKNYEDVHYPEDEQEYEADSGEDEIEEGEDDTEMSYG